MKPQATLLLSALVAMVASAATVKIVTPKQNGATVAPMQSEKKEESVYDRVMRTGVIRCGWVSFPPFVEKDPNTGSFNGIFVDYMNDLGKALNLKIDWTMETGWGDFVEALKTDKIDAFCAGGWANSKRAVHIDFTRPISYQGFSAFVRADDTRFDNNIDRANSEDIMASTIDGTTIEVVTESDFPKAKKVSSPQLTEVSNTLLDVSTGKADIAFVATYFGAEFMAKNPGKIRPVVLDRPLRAFGNVIAIKADQYRFKAMLDAATEELMNSGEINRIIAKGEKYPDNVYRVMMPYKFPEIQTKKSETP